MRFPQPQLQTTRTAGRIDGARLPGVGDELGDKGVSPVPSDATGVRDSGVRGREDATRPRRRYITH